MANAYCLGMSKTNISPMARTLARRLYLDDLSRVEDVPLARSGLAAYDGWVRAAGEAGDADTTASLSTVSRDAFAAAWDDFAASDGAG